MGRYSIPVWQMIVKSFKKEKKSKDYLTIPQIREIVISNFATENVNRRTIELQTIFHCVNHSQNKHGGGLHEKNPLFTTDGKGRFRLLTEKEKKSS